MKTCGSPYLGAVSGAEETRMVRNVQLNTGEGRHVGRVNYGNLEKKLPSRGSGPCLTSSQRDGPSGCQGVLEESGRWVGRR